MEGLGDTFHLAASLYRLAKLDDIAFGVVPVEVHCAAPLPRRYFGLEHASVSLGSRSYLPEVLHEKRRLDRRGFTNLWWACDGNVFCDYAGNLDNDYFDAVATQQDVGWLGFDDLELQSLLVEVAHRRHVLGVHHDGRCC